MVVLEFYLGLYGSVPGRIEAAAKAAVGETKETTEKIAATAAQLAHGDLVEQLGKAVNQVASDAAKKQQWKALGAGIAAAAISLLVTGWVCFDAGREAGYGAAIKVARNETAAAAWANTPEGQLAYRLALAGSLQQVARCSAPGWKIRNGACLPQVDAEPVHTILELHTRQVLGPVGMDYLHGQGIQSADIATDPVAAVGRIGAALENLAPEAREQFDRLAHATLRKHDLLQAA